MLSAWSGRVLTRKFFSSVVLLIFFYAWSTASSAVTLTQIVRHTLKTHPEILAAQANQRGTQFGIRRAFGGYLPKLNLRLARGHEQSDNLTTRVVGLPNIGLARQETGLNLDQMLFDGFRVRSEVMKERSDLKSADFDYMESQQEVIVRTAEAYLNVLRARELVLLSKNNIYVHEQNLKKITLRYRAGAGTLGEIALSKSRLALAKVRMEMARGELNKAGARYVSIVGIPPSKKMKHPRSIRRYLPKNLAKATKQALLNNPLINSTKAEMESAAAQIGIARSSYFPKFNLQLSAADNDDLDGQPGPNREFLAMLVLRYNLYNGGSDRAAVEQARAQELLSRHNVDQTVRETIERVGTAWAAWQAEVKRYMKQRNYVDYSKQVVIDYKVQFELGKRALFNVLDSENELFRARVGLTDAYYNALIEMYQLLASIGTLSPTIV